MIKSIERTAKLLLCALVLLLSTRLLSAQAAPTSASLTPFQANSTHLPWRSEPSSRAASASPRTATASSSSWQAFTPAKSSPATTAPASSAATSSTPSKSSPSGSPTRRSSSGAILHQPARRLLAPLHRRRHLHRSLHHPHHPPLELQGHASLLPLDPGRRRRSSGPITSTRPSVAHPTTLTTTAPTPTPASGTSPPRAASASTTSSIPAAPSTSAPTPSTSPAPHLETRTLASTPASSFPSDTPGGNSVHLLRCKLSRCLMNSRRHHRVRPQLLRRH